MALSPSIGHKEYCCWVKSGPSSLALGFFGSSHSFITGHEFPPSWLQGLQCSKGTHFASPALGFSHSWRDGSVTWCIVASDAYLSGFQFRKKKGGWVERDLCSDGLPGQGWAFALWCLFAETAKQPGVASSWKKVVRTTELPQRRDPIWTLFGTPPACPTTTCANIWLSAQETQLRIVS